MDRVTATVGNDPFVLLYRHNDGEGGHNIVEALHIQGRGVMLRTRTMEYTNDPGDGYPMTVTLSEALSWMPRAKLYWDEEAQKYELL